MQVSAQIATLRLAETFTISRESQDEADVVTKLSPHPVADTVSKLTGILSAKGIRLFAVIDQSAEARQAGLSLRETTLVIFGNPAAGTPVMAAAPMAATSRLSVRSWRANRDRRAPSARRIPNSFCRLAARTRSKLATFAHAISNTTPQAPIRMLKGAINESEIP